MSKKRCKRAQIALFLIIGIFMLFAAGFLFFIASQTQIQPKKIGIEQSVSQLVAQCLKQRVIESYAITGINAERTKNYVDHELLSCADLSVFEDQADISYGNVVSSVKVSDRVISTEITLPIIIRQGESVIRLNRFNYNLPRYYTTRLPIDSNGRLTKDVIARSADDRLELYIEAGTIAKTNDEEPLEEITIHTRSVTQRDPVLYYYTVYDLQPHGAYFQGEKPKLRIKYVPSFNIENTLRIVKREIDSNFWKKMDSRPDTQRQMIETEIVGFSEVGLDPECESKVFVKGEIALAEDEYGKCSGEYEIKLTGDEDKALCGIYLVDSSVEDNIEEQGFRMNYDTISAALYDQELIGLGCKDNPEEENCLHNPEVVGTINLAINNKVRPDTNKFFVKVDSDEKECSERKASLVFMVIGKNIDCASVEAGQCCDSVEGCKVTDPILPEEPPELNEPEPCGSKKGIVIHMRDVDLDPHYTDLFIEEAKKLVGPDGWVLEDVTIGEGNAQWFAQTVKDAGMKPIIRISPPLNTQGFDPIAFAEYAYGIGEDLSPPGYFVQVCNEPNGEQGWACEMSAEEYAQKMIVFEKRLHSEELDADRRIKVVSAGLNPAGSPEYAQALFDYTGEEQEDGTIPVFHDAIDIWATHAYDTPSWQAEMDIVSKENIPVLITEAGYPYGDSRLDALCPRASILKLMYNCLNPLAEDYKAVKDLAWAIRIPEGDEAPYVDTGKECPDKCGDGTCDCYSGDEFDCCTECKLWCVIKWDTEVGDWREAHEVFRDDMLNYYADWAENPIIIGVTPFLLFDDKEITGTTDGDIKFDYECEMDNNFRPRYWEYVTYRGQNGVPERGCEVTDRMPDPYRYTVFDAVLPQQYPTYDCPFLPSGYDEDVEGTSIPPGIPSGEECITGDCLTLCLDAQYSNGRVSWEVTISNKEDCGGDNPDFVHAQIGEAPPGFESCTRTIGSCKEGFSAEKDTMFGNINRGVTITLRGSYISSGTQQPKFCLYCNMIPGECVGRSDFCVSTMIGEAMFTGQGQVIARIINDYRFGGYIGSLEPSPPHADGNPEKAVVVEWSDKNYRFVFWHEASYVPFWELSDGTGLNYQFFEGERGSGELFNKYGRREENSHVEIIESGPNRVRVRWEYYDVNMDSGDRIGRGVETYTFYPNGLGIKEMTFYRITDNSFEPMEMMMMNPKGTYWWDNIPRVGSEYKTYTLLDAYSSNSRRGYATPNPDDINNAFYREEGVSKGAIEASDGVIVRVHMNDLDPFTVYGKNSGIVNEEIKEVGHWGYPHFVHWPIGWLTEDEEWKEGTQQEIQVYPSHTSIIGVDQQGNGPYKWLIGVSDKPDNDLQHLAQEWLLNPDEIPSDWE